MSTNSALGDQSMKSLSGLGMSLLSAVGQNGHDMPHNLCQICDWKGENVKQRILVTVLLYKDKVISLCSYSATVHTERNSGQTPRQNSLCFGEKKIALKRVKDILREKS